MSRVRHFGFVSVRGCDPPAEPFVVRRCREPDMPAVPRADFPGRGDLERHDHRGRFRQADLYYCPRTFSLRTVVERVVALLGQGRRADWRRQVSTRAILYAPTARPARMTRSRVRRRPMPQEQSTSRGAAPRCRSRRSRSLSLGGRRPLYDSLLPAGPGRVRLANQVRPAGPAPAQEPRPVPQESALPGDRARADGRAGDRPVLDEFAHQHGADSLRPARADQDAGDRDPRRRPGPRRAAGGARQARHAPGGLHGLAAAGGDGPVRGRAAVAGGGGALCVHVDPDASRRRGAYSSRKSGSGSTRSTRS